MRIGESVVFAMEYVEGLDLSRLVKAKGPLPVANACNYVHQAALGLQHAHEHGMVHRDIKPSNLMLARQGNRALIKVLDFGLAKVQSEGAVDGGLTHEGQMLGTPAYIAPEQISNARGADIRADIYSLGCTLYYLLTGGPPFQGVPLRHPPGASLDGRDAAEPEASGGAGGAGGPGGQDDGQGAGPSLPGAEGRRPGVDSFFKKGALAFKSPEADVSHAGQSGSGRPVPGFVSTPTQPVTSDAGPIAQRQRVATPSAPETDWNRPIDRRETERTPEETPAMAPTRRPPWLWPSLAAGVLLLSSSPPGRGSSGSRPPTGSSSWSTCREMPRSSSTARRSPSPGRAAASPRSSRSPPASTR